MSADPGVKAPLALLDGWPQGADTMIRTNIGHALLERLALDAAERDGKPVALVRGMAIAAVEMRRPRTIGAILHPPAHLSFIRTDGCSVHAALDGASWTFPLPEPVVLRDGTSTLLPETFKLDQTRELLLDELAGYPRGE